MEQIPSKDREILRSIAMRQREYANSEKNDAILKKWHALEQGIRQTPTVRLLFSNFRHEVITPRLQCTSDAARGLEASLLSTMVGRELFDDDTPIPPTYDMGWHTWVSPFSLHAKTSRIPGQKTSGYHIEPVIEDLQSEWETLGEGGFGVNRESTM